ncbi:MAG: CBS domain-containing protein [Planctomycetota bacterium]
MKALEATELMRRDVATVGPEMTLIELARFLEEERIHGAPVVNSKGRLVGVVSYTDLARGITEDHCPNEIHPYFWSMERNPSGAEEDPNGKVLTGSATVADIMSHDVVTASGKITAAELAELMLLQEIHRILISEDGIMMGIVSVTDLLSALVRYEESLGE